jgi:hypothetical protein
LTWLRPHCLAVSLLVLGGLGVSTAVQPAAAAPSATAAYFHDRDCADFSSQRQAQRFFERHNPGRDPHRLDADNDGIACEDLA